MLKSFGQGMENLGVAGILGQDFKSIIFFVQYSLNSN